jgi:hypothetical protein
MKQYAIKVLKETNSFEYTEIYLRDTEKKLKEIIKGLGGNDILVKIVDTMLEKINH